MLSDGSDLTRAGNAFQALAAAECGTSRRRYQQGTVSLDRVCRLMSRLEDRRTDSAKYAGSPSCRQWYINTHSRKMICSGTFSPCNWRSSPDTLPYLLAEQTSLAAALRTDCRRRSCVDEAPAITELQSSTLLRRRARTSVTTASRGRQCRTLRICRSAAKQARTAAVTCARKVTSELMYTPKLRTTLTG